VAGEGGSVESIDRLAAEYGMLCVTIGSRGWKKPALARFGELQVGVEMFECWRDSEMVETLFEDGS
jgi:hypothetical protein